MADYSAVKLEIYAQDWRIEVCEEKRQEAGLGPLAEGQDPREVCDIPASHFLVPSSYLTMEENQAFVKALGRDMTLDLAETQALETAIDRCDQTAADGETCEVRYKGDRSYEIWKYVKYAREGTDGYHMTDEAKTYYDAHFSGIKANQWSRGGYALLPQWAIDYLKK